MLQSQSMPKCLQIEGKLIEMVTIFCDNEAGLTDNRMDLGLWNSVLSIKEGSLGLKKLFGSKFPGSCIIQDELIWFWLRKKARGLQMHLRVNRDSARAYHLHSQGWVLEWPFWEKKAEKYQKKKKTKGLPVLVYILASKLDTSYVLAPKTCDYTEITNPKTGSEKWSKLPKITQQSMLKSQDLNGSGGFPHRIFKFRK